MISECCKLFSSLLFFQSEDRRTGGLSKENRYNKNERRCD